MVNKNNNKEHSDPTQENTTKPKILIIDDEPLNLQLFEGYLSNDYTIMQFLTLKLAGS